MKFTAIVQSSLLYIFIANAAIVSQPETTVVADANMYCDKAGRFCEMKYADRCCSGVCKKVWDSSPTVRFRKFYKLARYID